MSVALNAERNFKAITRVEKERKISSRSRRDEISVLFRGIMIQRARTPFQK
jgi:predicted GIY-YIG superfamily endonuclease